MAVEVLQNQADCSLLRDVGFPHVHAVDMA